MLLRGAISFFWAPGAVATFFHLVAELFHLVSAELAELFELFRREDFREGVHPVDAVFE